jgi:hypothetical protein
MPDGWHMLVFLAPIPVNPADVDTGRMATLPDGSHVDLREAFPASGYYQVGSSHRFGPRLGAAEIAGSYRTTAVFWTA